MSVDRLQQSVDGDPRESHRDDQLAEARWIGTPKICRRFGISRWTWGRWVREGRAPAPIQNLPGFPKWRVSDIDRFEAGRRAVAPGRRAFFQQAPTGTGRIPKQIRSVHALTVAPTSTVSKPHSLTGKSVIGSDGAK